MNSYPKFKYNDKNITTAIQGIVSWVTETDNYKDHFVYQTMMPKMHDDEKYGQSYAVRLLIHYLGDIHQPLHCLSRVDQNYPVGDKGGNDFKLPNHYDANNLHSLWDSVVYEFHKNDKLVSNPTPPIMPFLILCNIAIHLRDLGQARYFRFQAYERLHHRSC